MPCHSPIYVDNPRPWTGDPYIPVPCGGCATCQKNRISGWIFRLLQEDKVCKSSYFITLTYDNENVPRSKNGFLTLDKEALTKFWKRLRKHEKGNNDIKYYAVGEYGEKTRRPHYHAILFNVLNTDNIVKAWKFGNIDIGKVSGASIGYVAGYINKGKKIPIHRNDDRVPEFSRMSKGLGKSYLTEAIVNYHKSDIERNFVTMEGGYRAPLPRYYREKIYDESDREAQRKIIDEKYINLQAIEEGEFYRKHGWNADYHLYKEYEKLGKESKLANQRKKRKL